MLKPTAFALLLAVLVAAPAAAQHTVVLVRHAERADTTPGASPKMAADPDLSEAGRARAESLATALKDANITAILRHRVQTHTTDRRAARQGARADGQDRHVEDVRQTCSTQLKASKGNVLVVGHSNTVPDVIKDLGVTTPVTIDDTEFDNLFLVSMGTHPRCCGCITAEIELPEF